MGPDRLSAKPAAGRLEATGRLAPSPTSWRQAVVSWHVVIIAFVVLMPFALMADFYPDRERLNARGRPLARDWTPQVRHSDPEHDVH